MSILFQYTPSAGESKGGGVGYADLSFAGALTPNTASGGIGGNIDIVTEFPWTLTPLSSPALQEVPWIYLTEYIYEESQIRAMLETFGKGIPGFGESGTAATGGSVSDPYSGLYDLKKPSGFSYRIPYFSDSMFTAQNSWTALNQINSQDIANAGKVIGGTLQAVGLGASLFGGRVGRFGKGAIIAGAAANLGSSAAADIFSIAGDIGKVAMSMSNERVLAVDKPKLWSSGEEKTHTVEFPLYNTLPATDDKDWEQTLQKNWELCYLLTYQNLYNKRTYFTSQPPVYYEIWIPGVHYSKASYVTDLKITNKGNVRAWEFNWTGQTQTFNIPDCYSIQITFKDLLTNSKNLLHKVGNPTVTTSSAKSLTQVAQVGTGANFANGANGALNAAFGPAPASPNPYAPTGLGPTK